MTFDRWWYLHYGNTPLESCGAAGMAAMLAWEAGAAEERATCAKIARDASHEMTYTDYSGDSMRSNVGEEIAQAIEARGKL